MVMKTGALRNAASSVNLGVRAGYSWETKLSTTTHDLFHSIDNKKQILRRRHPGFFKGVRYCCPSQTPTTNMESGEAPRPWPPFAFLLAHQLVDAATEALSRDRLSYSSDETTVDSSDVSPPPPPPLLPRPYPTDSPGSTSPDRTVLGPLLFIDSGGGGGLCCDLGAPRNSNQWLWLTRRVKAQSAQFFFNKLMSLYAHRDRRHCRRSR